MNRTEFQQLAQERLDDAQALFAVGRWSGAYYLAGYAIECALKACIAKATQAEDFPRRDASKMYTHSLVELLGYANLPQPLGREREWSIIKGWSEQCRYDPPKTQSQAEEILTAITDTQKGILIWLQTQW